MFLTNQIHAVTIEKQLYHFDKDVVQLNWERYFHLPKAPYSVILTCNVGIIVYGYRRLFSYVAGRSPVRKRKGNFSIQNPNSYYFVTRILGSLPKMSPTMIQTLRKKLQLNYIIIRGDDVIMEFRPTADQAKNAVH